MLSYDEALPLAHDICKKHDIKTKAGWRALKKDERPGLPFNPSEAYKDDGWENWYIWLDKTAPVAMFSYYTALPKANEICKKYDVLLIAVWPR